MTNRIKGLAASVLISGALVASLRQRSENKPGISLCEAAQNSTAARHSTKPSHVSKEPRTLGDVAVAGDPRDMRSDNSAVFGAFNTWFEKYQTAEPRTPELLAEGEQVAIAREKAMVQLISTDPELALELAVPYERRKVLPESIVSHLEQRVSGMARYDVVAFAPGTRAEGSSPVERYVTLNNQTYTASVYGRRVAVPSQPEIALHGIAIGGALAVAEHPVRVLGAVEAADRAGSVSESAASCPVSKLKGNPAYAAEVGGEVRYFCHEGHIDALNNELEQAEGGPRARANIASLNPGWTQGNKSLLFMRVNFVDDPVETISAEDANTVMKGVNAFLNNNSYGSLSINATVTPLLTMPHPSAWYQQTSDEGLKFQQVVADARSAAAAIGIDWTRFDLDVVHLDPNVVSARGYVGQRGATLQDNDVGTACHELGHNLGLWHANGWRTTDGSIIGEGYNSEYGNHWDTMGSGGEYLEPFGAYSRYQLGWLPEEVVQTITNDGVYTLYPFDVPGIVAGQAYALKLRKDDQRDYWIQTRQNRSGELELNWSPWYQSDGGPELLDMTPRSEGGFFDAGLQIGSSFYDPELGVRIVPLRLSVTSPGAVDVLVKHVHYLALPAESANLSNGYASGADQTSGSHVVTLNPNGSALFTVNVVTDGDYTLWCRALGNGGPVAIAVDGNANPAACSIEPSNANGWRWSRVLSSISSASFTLPAGPHTLRLSGGSSLTKIDSLLLTDDPTADLPPLIEPIPDQVATLGKTLVVPFTVLSPGAGPGSIGLAVSSSNGIVVPDDEIETAQVVSQETTSLAITPMALGQTVITVTATSADGRSGNVSFNVSVVGEVQELINAAAPGDTIQLPAGVFIDHLLIDKNITLSGLSAAETFIDGNADASSLVISRNAVVSLKNLTIRNGTGGIVNSGNVKISDCEITRNFNSPHGGGAIWNDADAQMSIERSTISSNRCSAAGGGIYNLGVMRLVNSTISGNRSTTGEGGGINNAGQMEVIHCTLTLNRAHGGGGMANTGTLQMGNTIVAGNTADIENSPDLKGAVVSEGYNLIQNTAGTVVQGNTTGNIVGASPLIGPLANNGGTTHTHALLAGSPAIDRGDSAGLATDQRGVARALDALSVPNASDGADIGAYEFVPDPSDQPVVSGNSAHPRLALRRDADGGMFVRLEGGTESSWTVQATSDLVSWETLGVAPKGQSTELKDAGAAEAPSRFYRVTPY